MSKVGGTRLAALIVLALGVATSILARRLPAQSGFGLGPAFLPLWTGIVLAACGICLYLRAAENGEISWPNSRSFKRVGAGFLAVVLYAVALEPLGYLISSTAFLVLGMMLLQPARPLQALLLGSGSALFLFFIFRIWLRVPLPNGLSPW
jgi:putative tricarboxylic transport membrane protein